MRAHIRDTHVQAGGLIQNKGHKVRREFHMDLIKVEEVAHRRLRRELTFDRVIGCLLGFRFGARAEADRDAPEEACPNDEGQERQSRQKCEQRHQKGDGAKGGGIAAKLAKEGEIGGPRGAPSRK